MQSHYRQPPHACTVMVTLLLMLLARLSMCQDVLDALEQGCQHLQAGGSAACGLPPRRRFPCCVRCTILRMNP